MTVFRVGLRCGLPVLLLALAIFAAGCGGDDDDDSASPADDDTGADDDVDDDAADDDVDDDTDDDLDDDADDDADDDTDDDTGECVPLFPDVHVIAHRGARTWAPEDTIPAFQKAFELGADGVELDVRDTADGGFVLMHDDTVDRTTNGHGLVSDMTVAEIKDLKVDDWMYGGQHGTVRVPTFAEALEAIRDAGGEADLDMKTDDVAGAMQVVVDLGMEDSVWVYSSNPAKLQIVRDTAPGVRIQPSTASVEETQALIDLFDPDPERFELDGEDGFTPDNLALIDSVGGVTAMDALGVRDILAGVLDIKGAWREMMFEGVDDILTDFPAALIAYRDSLCQ